jgi:hypothetical protein
MTREEGMSTKRKAFVAFCTVTVFLVFCLAGCDWIERFFNPLIGEWAGTFTPTSGSPLSMEYEFTTDHTFTQAIVDYALDTAGTYVQDTAAKTVTMTITYSSDEGFVPVGYTATMTYAFSTDNNTMIFTTSGQPGTGVLTRQ